MKRKAFLLALLLSVVLSGRVAMAQQREVVWYYASGPEVAEPLIAAFQAAHPDIKVSAVTGGTGVIWARAEAEMENPLGDVFWAGDSKMWEMAKPGLFAPYESPEDQYYEFVDAEHIWHGTSTMLNFWTVNTKLMDPEDYPKSWKDLANIKYDAQIALINPSFSGTGYITTQGFLTHYDWDLLAEVMMNGLTFTSSSASKNAVRDGEVAIGLIQDFVTYEWVQGGAPLEILDMEEGALGTIDCIGLIANGPNPEEAKVFLDWFLSEEAQLIFVEQLGWRSLRKGTPPPEGLLPMSEVKLIDIPLELFEDPDGLKKTWNTRLGQAVPMKKVRNAAWDTIQNAEVALGGAREAGKTEGIDAAQTALTKARSAFDVKEYTDARDAAAQALTLAAKAVKPAAAPEVIEKVVEKEVPVEAPGPSSALYVGGGIALAGIIIALALLFLKRR